MDKIFRLGTSHLCPFIQIWQRIIHFVDEICLPRISLKLDFVQVLCQRKVIQKSKRLLLSDAISFWTLCLTSGKKNSRMLLSITGDGDAIVSVKVRLHCTKVRLDKSPLFEWCGSGSPDSADDF
ncbi:hypothetical protein CEXT_179701 [Caerostris extrusa]|uniref:Uncharacterized protein n=1 Tax=Caerostris extrusa TaxID=172846 RepID=A0AAV4WDE4_CAEEX|nr:hypothetical protein CEXT_179701 [Caerostris extrusa]